MKTKHMVLLGLLTAGAAILHIVESWLPTPASAPGVKLGLANVVSLFALAFFGPREALYVLGARIVLGGLFSGAIAGPAVFLSISGGMTSLLVMALLNRWAQPPFSLIGVSVLGATAHNAAQVAAAAILVGSPGVLWYLPYAVLFAVPLGAVTGMTALFALAKLPQKSLS
ncbi:MAG: Gx transporter family protein [Negativicutes bacterium]|nr:Gx transporter family protein [Negativicutes bacterium]